MAGGSHMEARTGSGVHGDVGGDGAGGSGGTRLLLRYDQFECEGTVRAADGRAITMDRDEREVLLGKGSGDAGQTGAAVKECTYVGDVAMGLHMKHWFTDAWGVDGSKGELREGGRVYTRAACGAFAGVQDSDVRTGESVSETEERRFGEGLHGAGLPPWYEVVDTELHAILLALRHTARKEEPEQRRCLIVSDCSSALMMMERAYRQGVRWKGEAGGRAGLLHAINCERAKLQLVVTMWAPAHRGGSVSA